MEPQQTQPTNQPDQQLSGQPGQQPQSLFSQPFQQPGPAAPQQFNQLPGGGQPARKSKLPLIIGIVAGIVLLLVIIIVVMAGSGDKTPVSNKPDDTTAAKSQAPQAATSNGIQLNDDAISQSLSTLNDDQDFQNSKFDDRSLNL